MAIKDDFVMTIDEDEIITHEEDTMDTEEMPAPPTKKVKGKKASKKKNAKQDQNKDSSKNVSVNDETEQFESGFSFTMEGANDSVSNGWDLSEARNMLKRKQDDIPRASIDDIIARKRKQTKLEKKAKRDTETPEAAADNDNADDAPFVAEDDEDLAADGFGGGAEDVESDENDSELSESEEEEAASESESEASSDENDDSMEVEETVAEKKRKAEYFDSEETNTIEHASFVSMNLSRPLVKALASLGFVKPTDIQSRTIPLALQSKDICGGAVTGSGKTAAFLIPIIERLLYRPRQKAVTRVLILCPTRELAAQVHDVGVKLAQFTDIAFCLCVGGLKLKVQEAKLKEKPDIVVATPGRLIDHVRNSVGMTLDDCEILVMDEADRMLEDGFADELDEIIKSCPQSRQTMLFSATMTDNVDQLVRMSLKNPVRLFVDPGHQAASRLVQEFVRIRAKREADRASVLLALCRKTAKTKSKHDVFSSKVIIFFRSKKAAHQMKIVFGLMGLNAGELHGNLTQEQRLESLELFRDGIVDFLLATDLAARGLDIKGVETVINYNMPTQFSQYLHRVGRTARAGRNGRSITLVGESDRKMLKLAIKSTTKALVKNRVVDLAVIEKYNEKLEELTPKIEEVLIEEKEERALQLAEMELRKGENQLKHQNEIFSRPARSWFQSNKEKQNAKRKGRPEQAVKSNAKK